MKKFIYLIAFACSMLTFSCSDPCKDNACTNGSTCDDGTCICTTGYSGTNCEIENRASFLGTWGGEVICDGDTPESSVFIITQSATGIDKVSINIDSDLDLEGTVLSASSLEVPVTSVDFGGGYIINISGSATIGSSQIVFTILLAEEGYPDSTCIFTASM